MNPPEWLLDLIDACHDWRDGEPYQPPKLFFFSV